ncbi:MAG: LPS export ABC transporter periplasmic protein LptC [Pseudomonadota bacterium]
MTTTPAKDTAFVWTPRRQVTLAQTRRRTMLVRLMRMAFIAGAAIAVGLLVGPVLANALSGLGDERRSFAGDEIVTMINPRFSGRDQSGAAYVITADTAQRRRADEDVIDLTNPKLVDETGSQVTAPEGTYNRASQTLDLFRDVQVSDEAGYRFKSTSARFFVMDGRIEGREPLYGTGPLGDIRSDGYEITEDGDVITFSGNVEMVFDGKAPAEVNAPGADAPVPEAELLLEAVERDGENG